MYLQMYVGVLFTLCVTSVKFILKVPICLLKSPNIHKFCIGIVSIFAFMGFYVFSLISLSVICQTDIHVENPALDPRLYRPCHIVKLSCSAVFEIQEAG